MARPRQEIRFTTTGDGVSLAYAIAGKGPPLVKAANWLSHLEYDWDSPVWRPYVETLSSRFTYIRYDERGTGLSTADITDLTFDDFVSDLEAVVDAADLERFPLLGISQGGSVATTYAVRHPERVSHLILVGAYAQGRLKRGDQQWIDNHDLQVGLVRQGWGTDDPTFRHVFSSQFIPGGSANQHAWFDELMRQSATTENALIIFDVLGNIDVTAVAPEVTTPTLVLHSRGDRRVPFEQGRLLAGLIPGARLVPLESDNHLPLGDEPAWRRFMQEIISFVGLEVPAQLDERRAVATLLMTDIVDSTKLAGAVGEEDWARLIEWHDRTLQDLLTRAGGRVLNNTGDGFLVAFDDDLAALEASAQVQRHLEAHRRDAGFAPKVRIGIHAGEFSRIEEGVGGIEVHKTARVASAAGPDEILVSSEVADATTDRFSYDDPRLIPAKGIDEGLEVRTLRWR